MAMSLRAFNGAIRDQLAQVAPSAVVDSLPSFEQHDAEMEGWRLGLEEMEVDYPPPWNAKTALAFCKARKVSCHILH